MTAAGPPGSGVAGPRRVRGRVRPVRDDDLGALTDLHRRTFGSSAAGEEELSSYLLELLCRHPWLDERLPSLVYETGDGRLVGCLGVMPRPLSLDGEPILGVVSHNFMVDPEHRSSMAGIELMKALFSGPQDLALAEGNDSSRRLWKALRGTVSLTYSLRWTHPLAPGRFALSVLERRDHVRPFLATGLRPVAGLVDALATRLPGSPLRSGEPAARTEELDVESLAAGIEQVSRRRLLRPRYGVEELTWILWMLGRRPDGAALRSGLVRAGDRVAGWYLYHLRAGGVADVVQLGATEQTAGVVLDRLFHDAREAGAAAVSGLLDPPLLPALSERLCLYHRGRDTSWLLVKGRNDRAVRALHTGDAFFTHLEGEWWL